MNAILFLPIFTLAIQTLYVGGIVFHKPKSTNVIHSLCYGDDAYKNVKEIRYGLMNYCNYYSYFVNLNANFGNNSETQATCGYVALAMLLNYYDCYLNDSIVSENFEVCGNNYSSPGTVYEANSGLPNNSVAQYYNYLRSYYLSTSLHAYLILLHKGAIDTNPISMESTYLQEFGTNYYFLSDLINEYLLMTGLNTYCTVVSNYSQKPGESNASVAEEIYNEIDNGYPVLSGFNQHYKIIYGHSDDYIKLCGHNGYLNSSQTEYLIQYDGTAVPSGGIDYFSFHFNLSHSHSYNYYNTSGNYYYCQCGAIYHTTHSYTHHYEYYSSNYHKSYCVCDQYILEKHSYRINIHYDPCVCGSSVWD